MSLVESLLEEVRSHRPGALALLRAELARIHEHKEAVQLRQPTEPFATSGLPKRRPGACKHVGQAIDVRNDCSGARSTSVWSCELHGQCAPLAQHTIGPHTKVCAQCDDWEPAPEPGWVRLGLNFLSAIGRWQKAGQPTRSAERVNELLAICESCPFLAQRGTDRQYCGKCGCPINGRVDKPTENKLALATERCPLNPPRWEAEG